MKIKSKITNNSSTNNKLLVKKDQEKLCKITLLDEVNIHISNLETIVLSKLHKNLSFFDPSAKYLPAYKMRRWDGKVSYFDLNGKSYYHLLPEIIKTLEEYEYKIVLCDKRNKVEFEFESIDQEYLKKQNIKWPKGHHLENQDIILRDYQVEIINNFLAKRHAVQEIATGAGKTIITAVLAKSVEKYGRTITIVPSKSLVKQTYDDFKNIGLDVGIFFGDSKQTKNQHIIATWQSLESMRKRSKKEENLKYFDELKKDVKAIIVDECHIAKAPSLKRVLGTMFSDIPIRWGLTATIPRENYLFYAVKSLIGPPVNFMTAAELQDRGVLSSCDVHIIEIQDEKEDFQTYHEEKKYLLTNERRLKIIAELANEVSQQGNTLILVDFVKTAKKLGTLTNNSYVVTGSDSLKKKQEKFELVKEEDNMILIATYGVAAVGINLPKLYNIILVEAGKSIIRVMQSIGRGLRKTAEKNHVVIYDICGSTKRSKKHMIKRKRIYKQAKYPFTHSKI